MSDIINLSDTLTLLLHEMVSRTEEFRLFDVNRILLCCSTNRKTTGGGIYGKLLPMRFENGSEIVKHNSRFYTIPKLVVNDIEILYLMYFYMPKFFDLPAAEKVNVMFHELYHISPAFNGDIRRMGSVKKAHGHSKKAFEEKYIEYSRNFYEYVRSTPYHAFLSMRSDELRRRFKKVNFRRMKAVKPVELKPAQKI
ncbi:MAG TPA: putative metallopeptidase [Spirochaetota bacterium]|nr:putative metallopeptidase [Spirochaetota bacterium]